jgi:hypothetical protein
MNENRDRTQDVMSAIRPKAKRLDVIAPYALAIFESQHCSPPLSVTDWGRVNRAIIACWSIGGLQFIKREAWKRAAAAAKALSS